MAPVQELGTGPGIKEHRQPLRDPPADTRLGIFGVTSCGGLSLGLMRAEVLDMGKKNTAQPVNPFHPGEILLEEFLQPGKITQAAFARRVGWTKARLNEFVRGKRGVTADAALDLGEALGTSARLWMNLQSTRDLSQAEKRRSAA